VQPTQQCLAKGLYDNYEEEVHYRRWRCGQREMAMSDEPKFSFFRLSIKPISFRIRNASKSHSISPTDTAPAEERKANLKRAFFFSGVAILLILANQLGHVKDDSDSNSSAASVAGAKLALYPQQHPDNQGGLVVRFRLSNIGNHPVFYPVRPGTTVPVGQIVTRTSPSTEWMTLAVTSKQQTSAAPEFIDPNLAWIEMPPGGWADGELYDPNESRGERAYAIYLKPEPNANVIRIVSETYHSLTN
jgi:hypothetical protein